MLKIKKKIMTVFLLAAIISQTLGSALFPAAANTVFANSTMNGSGTAEDPYQISTLNQLKGITQGLDKHYILVSDIEFVEEIIWHPIGTSSGPFTGTFDGNGYKLKNFHMDSGQDCAGLFGYTNTAVFKNVEMENVDVAGKNYVGALIAYSTGTTNVEDCTVYGTVHNQWKRCHRWVDRFL